MTIRPFFSYYGGKWRFAKTRYPAPAHDTIVEPFAGSAGYSLRYADRAVVLCEKDPVVASVWRYLLRVSEQEVLALPDVPNDGTVDDLPLPQEARWLIGFWLNKGSARPCRQPSSWMRTGLYAGSFWGDRVRQTISKQLAHIRHWRLFEGSYEDCPVTGPATWFVDPPYQEAGRFYRHGAATIDYPALGAWCRAQQGQVIVCENLGADWLPFESVGPTKTTRKGRRSEEAVWLQEDYCG